MDIALVHSVIIMKTILIICIIILVLITACNSQSNVQLSEEERKIVNEMVKHASIYRNSNPNYFIRNATTTDISLSEETGANCHFRLILYPSFIPESDDITDCPKAISTLLSVSPIGSLDRMNLSQYNITHFEAGEYYSLLVMHSFNSTKEASEYIKLLQQFIRILYPSEIHFLQEYEDPGYFIMDTMYQEYEYHYLASFIHSMPNESDSINYVKIIILKRNNEVLVHRVFSDQSRVFIRPIMIR